MTIQQNNIPGDNPISRKLVNLSGNSNEAVQSRLDDQLLAYRKQYSDLNNRKLNFRADDESIKFKMTELADKINKLSKLMQGLNYSPEDSAKRFWGT